MRNLLLILLVFSSFCSARAQWEPDSISIFFDFNSGQPILNQKGLQQIKDLGAIKDLKLSAFTDTTGSDAFNSALAKQRSETVKGLLGDSILISEVIIKGETLDFGSDEMNRRVDLHFQRSVAGKETREYLVLNIQFVTNKAVVKSESYPRLDELAERIKKEKFTSIELHGHVCCGPDMKLSQNRALAIRKKLVERGIDPDIFDCYGHSNFSPLYPEQPGAGNDKNKRVEAVLIKTIVSYE